MAGWDVFLNAMTQVGVSNGCIMSRQDGAIWSASAGFALDTYSVEIEVPNPKRPAETIIATEQVNEHQILLHLAANQGQAPNDVGIYLNRKKYFRVNFDPDKKSIYLKSRDGFACIAYTEKVIVYGSWVGLPPGPCNERIEYLAGEVAKAGF